MTKKTLKASILSSTLLVLALTTLNAMAATTIATPSISTDYKSNLSALTPTVVREAVNGYRYAIKKGDVQKKSILTVVNFTQPSFEKRMWVIDPRTGHVLLSMHVAQGKNSGTSPAYATKFSNIPGSLESSPGVFTTDYEYYGEHGKSMRISGLEQGINNNAMSRAVVIHPAWYVTPSFVEKYGYTGRSWGCFAFDPKRAPQFLHDINHKTVLFAYAPSEKNDPTVDHQLSAKGKKIYRRIEQHINGSKISPKGFIDHIEQGVTQAV